MTFFNICNTIWLLTVQSINGEIFDTFKMKDLTRPIKLE